MQSLLSRREASTLGLQGRLTAAFRRCSSGRRLPGVGDPAQRASSLSRIVGAGDRCNGDIRARMVRA